MHLPPNFAYSKFTERCPREMACQIVEPSRSLFNWQGVDFFLQIYYILIRGFTSVILYLDVTTATLISASLMIIQASPLYFFLWVCLTSCRGGLFWSHTRTGAVYRLFRQWRPPGVAIYIWRKLLWLVWTQSHGWKGSSNCFASQYHDRRSSWRWSGFRPTLSWETRLL